MKLNVGKPVTGSELIGRENEISQILQTLKAGQSIAIIAPRRFGKTSIMLEVLQRLSKNGYFTGNIDIFTIPNIGQLALEITGQVLKNRKLDEAFNKLRTNLTEILKNVKFRNEIQDAEFILSFGKTEKNEWDQLNNSLSYIESFSVKHHKECCFAFDEFGDINKLDGNEIVKLFRGIIQKQSRSVYIFTGSYESVMDQLFVNNNSPFYRMVKIIEPGFINFDALKVFFKKKFRELEIPVVNDHILRGIQFTKGHPYYIRLFIQEYYFQYFEDKKFLNPDNVFRNMLITEKSYLEKLWDDISSKKETKYLIIRLIETSGKPYTKTQNSTINISRAIKELNGKGIISSDDSGYFITDPLLEMYIRPNVLKLKV
jgi:hypothetical protein